MRGEIAGCGGHRPRSRSRARPVRPAARRSSGAPIPDGARRERRPRLGHVLVRGPLSAPRLQPPLLLPGRAGRQRRRRSGLRCGGRRALRVARRAGVGRPRALAVTRVRRRGMRAALHGHVPLRGGPRRRPWGAQGAPARPDVGGRRARRRDRRALAARLPLSLPGLCGRVSRGLAPPRPPRRRDGRGATRGRALPGCAAPRLPVRGGVPVLPPLGGAGGDRCSAPSAPLSPCAASAAGSSPSSSGFGHSAQPRRTSCLRRSART